MKRQRSVILVFMSFYQRDIHSTHEKYELNRCEAGHALPKVQRSFKRADSDTEWGQNYVRELPDCPTDIYEDAVASVSSASKVDTSNAYSIESLFHPDDIARGQKK